MEEIVSRSALPLLTLFLSLITYLPSLSHWLLSPPLDDGRRGGKEGEKEGERKGRDERGYTTLSSFL